MRPTTIAEAAAAAASLLLPALADRPAAAVVLDPTAHGRSPLDDPTRPGATPNSSHADGGERRFREWRRTRRAGFLHPKDAAATADGGGGGGGDGLGDAPTPPPPPPSGPLSPRIVGGRNAIPGRYPWLMSLQADGGHVCGATLVASDVALTAAHCFGQFVVAVIGRYDLRDYSETLKGEFEVREVDRTPVTLADMPGEEGDAVVYGEVKHPEYSFTDTNFDISHDLMLVKLAGGPLDGSKYPPLKLNRLSDVPGEAGQKLGVVGWGTVDPNGTILSDVLKEATLDYVPNLQCSQSSGLIAGKLISFASLIEPNMLCAFKRGEDACRGDSGGPIIVKGVDAGGKDDVQVGVVSFGVGCAHPDFPGIYARISDQINWIDPTICALSDYAGEEFGCAPREAAVPDTPSPTESPTLRPTGLPTSAPTMVEPPPAPWNEGETKLNDDGTQKKERKKKRKNILGGNKGRQNQKKQRQRKKKARQQMPTTAPATVPPTAMPSAAPTRPPTFAPTPSPTLAPTHLPTSRPTTRPTAAPSVPPSAAPSAPPSAVPTSAPSGAPSASRAPSREPSAGPTDSPPPTKPVAARAQDCGRGLYWMCSSATRLRGAGGTVIPAVAMLGTAALLLL